MWRMLRADVSYNWLPLVVGYGIGAFSLLIAGDLKVGPVELLLQGTAVAFYGMLIFIGIRNDKEKRDRLHRLLPRSVFHHGQARLLFIVLFQLSLLAIWLIVYRINQMDYGPETAWEMLSTNALRIALVLFFVIYHDLGHLASRMYRMIFWVIIIGVVLATEALLSIFWRSRFPPAAEAFTQFSSLLQSAPAALVSTLICLGLLYLSLTIFVRRRSYIA